MHPILFELGPLKLYSYGLTAAAGVGIAILFLRQNSRKIGIAPEAAADLALVIVFFGFAGARLFYVVQHWPYFKGAWLETVQIWKGGLVLYGGVLAGFAALLIFTRVSKLPFLKTFDLFAPAAALAQGFGRLGCFLNGCCYGRKSDLPWAVRFPSFDDAVHPVQLYEALFCFLLAGFLFSLWRHKPRPGSAAASYLLLYGAGRFFLEFARGDNPSVLFTLTLPQIISVGMFLSGALLAVYSRLVWKPKN